MELYIKRNLKCSKCGSLNEDNPKASKVEYSTFNNVIHRWCSYCKDSWFEMCADMTPPAIPSSLLIVIDNRSECDGPVKLDYKKAARILDSFVRSGEAGKDFTSDTLKFWAACEACGDLKVLCNCESAE